MKNINRRARPVKIPFHRKKLQNNFKTALGTEYLQFRWHLTWDLSRCDKPQGKEMEWKEVMNRMECRGGMASLRGTYVTIELMHQSEMHLGRQYLSTLSSYAVSKFS